MSEFTRLIESKLGQVKADFLHCDWCGNAASKDSAVNWIHSEPVGIAIERIGHIPSTGDFCSPLCIIRYYNWQEGDAIPFGVEWAERFRLESVPRYEVIQDGRILYRGNDKSVIEKFTH